MNTTSQLLPGSWGQASQERLLRCFSKPHGRRLIYFTEAVQAELLKDDYGVTSWGLGCLDRTTACSAGGGRQDGFLFIIITIIIIFYLGGSSWIEQSG